MDKRLAIRIKEYNKRQKDYNSVFGKHNSKRIIIGTLKPNCDKSLK